MARDILNQYGRNSSQPQAAPVSCGGVLPGYTKDVMNYQPPYGPKNINDPQGPGLHGVNNGVDGVQGGDERLQRGGKVGLGGKNLGCCGSQGKY